MKISRALMLMVVGLGLVTVVPATNAAPPAEQAQAGVKDVSPEEAEALLKSNKSLIVLDIRTEGEFKQGHIAGAKNLDFQAPDFASKVAALDKSKPYLLHCASGGRSTRSLQTFETQKFQSIFHLKSGFKGWESAGKPVEK